MNHSLQCTSLWAELKQPSRLVLFTFCSSNLQEILHVSSEKADLPQNSFSFSADTGRDICLLTCFFFIGKFIALQPAKLVTAAFFSL